MALGLLEIRSSPNDGLRNPVRTSHASLVLGSVTGFSTLGRNTSISIFRMGLEENNEFLSNSYRSQSGISLIKSLSVPPTPINLY